MPHVNIQKSTIYLTEKTLKELLHAVNKSKKFNKRRVKVESNHSGISFVITNDQELHPQASLGYDRVFVKNETTTSINVQRNLSKEDIPEWYEL